MKQQSNKFLPVALNGTNTCFDPTYSPLFLNQLLNSKYHGTWNSQAEVHPRQWQDLLVGLFQTRAAGGQRRKCYFPSNHRSLLLYKIKQFCCQLGSQFILITLEGFPGGSAGKESVCNAGDLGSIPGLGRSPGEWNGYPLQYSGLENSMDCKVHGVAKSQT